LEQPKAYVLWMTDEELESLYQSVRIRSSNLESYIEDNFNLHDDESYLGENEHYVETKLELQRCESLASMLKEELNKSNVDLFD
jgi:hypothetical protein